MVHGYISRDDLSAVPITSLGGNQTSIRPYVFYETGPPDMHPSLPFPAADERSHRLTLDVLSWDAIFSTDVTSPEGLSSIATLLHSPSKTADARSLHGDQAQRFIDLLDQVSIVIRVNAR